jgi:hypothetical protein
VARVVVVVVVGVSFGDATGATRTAVTCERALAWFPLSSLTVPTFTIRNDV